MSTDRELRNLLIYVLIAVAQMALIVLGAALGTGTLPGFRPGGPFEPAGPALAALIALLAPIVATWLAANRPRLGSAELAHQVDQARKGGTPRHRLMVQPKVHPVVGA
jgi:hypothetical protein